MTGQDESAVAVGGEGRSADPRPIRMATWIFALELGYLAVLVGVFVAYETSGAFRADLPRTLGPLPGGVVWFAATGAVIAWLRGIFAYSRNWDPRFNYWQISRPLFGAVTGSVGALVYWVTLRLGSTGPVKVDAATFDVVAFVLGFADRAFMEMLQEVTKIIIKPSGQAAGGGNAVHSS